MKNAKLKSTPSPKSGYLGDTNFTSTPGRKLMLSNAVTGPKNDPIVICSNEEGERVLTLVAMAGSDDVKAMEAAALEPGNDEDVFAYANKLLGNSYDSFEFDHIGNAFCRLSRRGYRHQELTADVKAGLFDFFVKFKPIGQISPKIWQLGLLQKDGALKYYEYSSEEDYNYDIEYSRKLLLTEI
ncbi:MAG: hypothetical protein ABJH04_08175 [Cyclobacteriaceae bacterium]